ncbi:MAG: IS1595 family transposase [Pasteurella sp.]|nr:IS1595 family transposase [Pasteurella sp.]
MTIHHLLSSKSKDIDLLQIAKLSEEEAFHIFKTIRWGYPDDINNVCCPLCKVRHRAYFLKTRKRWRCKCCNREFTVTSKTAFASHKLSLVKLLSAIFLFVGLSKGISAISMSRCLGINYQTAYVLCQKMRETLFKTRDLSSLHGLIHEDGCWINFRVRKKNYRKVYEAEPKDSSKLKQELDKEAQQELNSTKKKTKKRKYPRFRKTKRCVINFSQASNDPNIQGPVRTIVAMDYTENADTVLAMNHRFVEGGSIIMSDENPAYKDLMLHYHHLSINHQQVYSHCGINNNYAESYNARFRDLHRGVHHKHDNKYALLYANEAGYRSDYRRKTYKELLQDILFRCLSVLPLKEWNGYWQGNHREKEMLGMDAFAPQEISKEYFERLTELASCNQDIDILKMVA